ncbi:PHO85 cyclin-like protein psl1 [Choanephora cucurbitarum]|uniref:PHO85 cyclin-like protein psl1 n=1 Tax=Choanephora cucurbitarum TaxID=101091 RepID=A0A1C7NGV2_9FUNG|nr:PHO85 cyclin-like protein psl1 [Choanephora cucurbitarum]
MNDTENLHFDLATFPVKETIKLLTALLEKITRTNDQLQLESGLHKPSTYTCFHARSIPTISIHAYFTRILKYCPCANECLIALLVYFDRMTQPSPHLTPLHIDSYNIHRLIITGLMISSKLYSDVFFTNTRYAKVGGLPVGELNALELEFLRLNSYNLFVDIDKLQRYGDNVLELWSHSQDISALAIRETGNNHHSDNVIHEEIARPFSRLTMRTNDKCKMLPSGPESPTSPTSPLAESAFDRHWRYSRQSFSLRRNSTGNGATTDIHNTRNHM